jgi:hypothetical protein
LTYDNERPFRARSYALGITEVDPARMSMLFERFVSREREEPPDIHVDFEISGARKSFNTSKTVIQWQYCIGFAAGQDNTQA